MQHLPSYNLHMIAPIEKFPHLPSRSKANARIHYARLICATAACLRVFLIAYRMF